jgi:hypothetical protein
MSREHTVHRRHWNVLPLRAPAERRFGQVVRLRRHSDPKPRSVPAQPESRIASLALANLTFALA